MSSDWRSVLTPDEVNELAEVEGKMAAHKPIAKIWSGKRRAIYVRAVKRLGRQQKVVDISMGAR